MRRPSMDRLLETLYDANFGEPDFTRFMQTLGAAMRSHILGLQVYDPATGNSVVESQVGITPQLLASYTDVAGENLWFVRGAEQLLARGITDDEELDCMKELHKTRFHADFLQPADLEHGMGLCIERTESGEIVTLTINRDRKRGHFDDNERQLATGLLPHIRNAYTLHRQLRRIQSLERSYRAALDRMPEGVLFLDASGTILFANEQAQAIEAEGHMIRREHGRLAAVQLRENRTLQSVLSRMTSAGFSGTTQRVRLHDRNGHPVGLVSVCPTPPAALAAWSEPGVAAMVFVKSLVRPHMPVDDRLQAAWSLTPAESQLAGLLLQGLSLEEASRRLGVSKNTVRSQLRGLFDKTGTHRQGELVSLLLHAA
jgi:DNA-binding CsgD family transcriptional regulator/PAS domain-containing protein